MRTFRLGRPSPALVISIVALIVALGGTSYAAFSVPKNSVGSKQLRKSAVTTKKIANGAVTDVKIGRGAVTSAKIANATITGKQINLGKLGTVPTATSASHASDADALGGSPAAAYQTKILWARVGPSGTLTAGSGATSSGQLVGTTGKLIPGQYEVDFDRQVTNCAYEATIGSSLENNDNLVDDNGPGLIYTEPRANNADAVFVATFKPNPSKDLTGAYIGTNNAFHLAVIC